MDQQLEGPLDDLPSLLVSSDDMDGCTHSSHGSSRAESCEWVKPADQHVDV